MSRIIHNDTIIDLVRALVNTCGVGLGYLAIMHVDGDLRSKQKKQRKNSQKHRKYQNAYLLDLVAMSEINLAEDIAKVPKITKIHKIQS